MIKIILNTLSESAPTKVAGLVNNRKFWFYFKHGKWNFDIYMDDGGPDKIFEGRIGGDEDDDMSEEVARAIVIFQSVRVFNDPEVEIVTWETNFDWDEKEKSFKCGFCGSHASNRVGGMKSHIRLNHLKGDL